MTSSTSSTPLHDSVTESRRTLERLVSILTAAVHPARVALAGDGPGDAEVLVTPVALRRVGRSRRNGAVLDLELTVQVIAEGSHALDHLERLLVVAEQRGLPVAAPPATPMLGMTVALPVSVPIEEPTGPPVETVVVDVHPGVRTEEPAGTPAPIAPATSGPAEGN